MSMSMADEAEDAILAYLKDNDEISNSANFAQDLGFSHDDIVNVIRRLHGFRLVDAKDIRRERWVLTEEGKTYAAVGSPEFQLFSAVPSEGIAREDLQKKLDPAVYKIGCQQAIKNKWVEMAKTHVSKKVQHADDKVKNLLLRIQNDEAVNQEDIDALKRRKLIIQQVWKGNSVRKGPEYAPKRKRAATDLTRENLQRGDWKELEFKEYNFSAKGQPVEGGHLHPLLKACFGFLFHY
uniref:PheRS DNA binding domain-containing protein n=1 Tax=Solanum lycopersicum TaxID=4081 RepID=A0A3Q7IBT1_SOLLC